MTRPSPFYHEPEVPDPPAKEIPAKVAYSDDNEEYYQRLDRGLALVEQRETFQQGLDDLYALRDDIYRKLR